MKRAKNILLHFLLISLTFGFLGVRPVSAAETLTGSIRVWQDRIIEKDGKNVDVQCNIYGSCVEANTPFNIEISDLTYSDGTIVPNGTNIKVTINAKGFGGKSADADRSYQSGKVWTTDASDIKVDKEYEIKIRLPDSNWSDNQKVHVLKKHFTNSAEANCDPELCNENLETANPYKVCNQIDKTTDEYKRCMECFADMEGIWTAVGCIPQDPTSAVGSIVQIGLGIAGGIVLIMILVGAFMFSTSQGDPNKTKEAKEIITSAIIGLIFVIFSVTMLQFIGVNILQIPGFGQ